MAEKSNSRADDASERRRWALLVSSLVTSSDAELPAFQRRRGVDSSVPVDRLKLARAYLERLGEALASNESEHWEAFAGAASALGIGSTASTHATDHAGNEAPANQAAPRGAGAPSEQGAKRALGAAAAPTAEHRREPGASKLGPVLAETPPSPEPPRLAAVTLPEHPTKLAPPRAKAAPSPGPPVPAKPPLVAAPPEPPALISSLGVATEDAELLATLLQKNPSLAAFADGAASAASGTVVVSGTHDARPVLPFREELPQSQAHEGDATKSGGPDPERTLAFDSAEASAELAAVRAAALSSLPSHLVGMPLERYAALCAQCRVYPEWRSSVEQSFGVNGPAERDALDAHWRGLFERDASLEQAFRWHRDQQEQLERDRHR